MPRQPAQRRLKVLLMSDQPYKGVFSILDQYPNDSTVWMDLTSNGDNRRRRSRRQWHIDVEDSPAIDIRRKKIYLRGMDRNTKTKIFQFSSHGLGATMTGIKGGLEAFAREHNIDLQIVGNANALASDGQCKFCGSYQDEDEYVYR